MPEHSVDEKKVEATPKKRSASKAEKITEPLTNLSESSQNISLKKRRLSNSIQDLSDPISTTEQTGLFTFFTRELNRNVFRFLDAPALCKAAQVSKRWRAIVDSDAHIWIHQFQKEGFVLGNNEKEAFAQTLGITNQFDHQEVNLLKNYRTSKDKGPLKSTPANKGSTSKGNDYDSDSDTAREDSDSEEEAFMAPEAASPSLTNNDPGQLNEITSESTKHPYKALFKRHWIIRQNWAKGRAKRIQFTGHGDHVVTCLQFDSEKIISGSDDQSIHVYDIVNGNRLKKLDGHEGGVWALQYRDNTLVTGSTDRTVRVWDIEKGVCTHIFRGHTSTVRCLQIVMPVNVNKDPHGIPKYEPEFPVIVTGSRDATLKVWRLPDPELNSHIPPTDKSWLLRTLVGHTMSIRALAAEGSTLVSGSYDCTVRVWNICTGALVHRLQGHTQKVYSVVLDTERNQCMSGGMDGPVRIWSLEDGSCLHVLEGHESLVGLLSLNDNYFLSAAADCTVRIWDPTSGTCLRVLAAHAAAITCFQHDGNKVISGSDGYLKICDLETGKFIRNLLTGLGSVWQVKFDERRCVAAFQKAGANGAYGANVTTYFEVLDYGVYGIEEPLENAPLLPDELIEASVGADTL